MDSEKWDEATAALHNHQQERALRQLEEALSFVEESYPDVFLRYTISAACGTDGVYFTLEKDGEENRRHYGLMDLEQLNESLSQAEEIEPNPGFHGVDEPCDYAEPIDDQMAMKFHQQVIKQLSKLLAEIEALSPLPDLTSDTYEADYRKLQAKRDEALYATIVLLPDDVRESLARIMSACSSHMDIGS